MSSLLALSGFKLELDVVQKVIKDYTNVTKSGKFIVLCWNPSHVSIAGNERADTPAKSSLSLPIIRMKLPGSHFIPRISKFCMDEWQDIWNNYTSNKLHYFSPTVGTICHCNSLTVVVMKQ